jgi:hypothetical protein
MIIRMRMRSKISVRTRRMRIWRAMQANVIIHQSMIITVNWDVMRMMILEEHRAIAIVISMLRSKDLVPIKLVEWVKFNISRARAEKLTNCQQLTFRIITNYQLKLITYFVNSLLPFLLLATKLQTENCGASETLPTWGARGRSEARSERRARFGCPVSRARVTVMWRGWGIRTRYWQYFHWIHTKAITATILHQLQTRQSSAWWVMKMLCVCRLLSE